MKNTLVEAVRLFNLKLILNQKQSCVKHPQMPLIQVGQVSIPNCLENQGLLCVGSSRDRLNASINLVRQLKQRTDFRGIILDRNGELLERFFDPALDTIFAPILLRCDAEGGMLYDHASQTLRDHRSINWCHKSESVSGKELARSLINIEPADPFFYQAAIEVLAVIFENSNTNDEVWQKLNVLMPQDLQAYLPSENSLASEMLREPICAVAVTRIIKEVTQFYRYLGRESEFSFYDWGNNDDPGWLFIPWFDGDTEDATLMPLRQMAIDLVLQGLLARKEVVHHRTAVVIPDLSCLKLNSLPRFVTECRNRQCQGYPLLGVDSVSSAIAGYGQQNTQVIFECMQTKLLFNEGLLDINSSNLAIKQNLLSQQGYLAVDGCFAKVKISDK